MLTLSTYCFCHIVRTALTQNVENNTREIIRYQKHHPLIVILSISMYVCDCLLMQTTDAVRRLTLLAVPATAKEFLRFHFRLDIHALIVQRCKIFSQF